MNGRYLVKLANSGHFYRRGRGATRQWVTHQKDATRFVNIETAQGVVNSAESTCIVVNVNARQLELPL